MAGGRYYEKIIDRTCRNPIYFLQISSAASDEVKGIVTSVADGDTFDVQYFGTVRLADIYSPEGGTAGTEAAKAYAETLRPTIEQIKACGARTLRDIAAQLQARSIKTARGGSAWSPQQVSNLLNQLQGECNVWK